MQRLGRLARWGLAVLVAGCLAGGQWRAAAAGPPVNAGTPSAQRLHAPDERDSFDFLIFGDRTGGPPEDIAVLADGVQMANRLDVDLVMTVGDMVQGYNQPEKWLRQMREFKGTMDGLHMPWYPVAGNHDVYSRPKREGGNTVLYVTHFGPLYYSFDYKWAHFIVLYSDEMLSFADPAKNQNMSPEQIEWLRGDLAGTDAGQIFVFLHHPRWTGGYDGCNWNEVHRLFVADGRPITVFAGHLHVYRDDGQRENVHYYALATTGGHMTGFPETASLHHANFVRVRRGRIAVSVLPIGAVRGGDFVLGEEVDMMEELAGGAWLSLRGQATITAEPGAQSSFTVALSNPTDRAMPFALSVKGGRGWELAYEPTAGEIKAGQTLTFDVRATAPSLSEAPPRIVVNAKASYPLRSGLAQPIEVQASVPVRLQVGDALTGATPTDNGVLTLDGQSAVRVDLPAELAQYTLECWVRGQPPAGRAALVTKTESSAYGIFWSDTDAGDQLPIGYVGTTGGYLSLPAARPWEWGQWTHVALVFDGRRAAFYVNGQLQNEQTTEAAGTHNRHPLYVGADPDSRGQPVSFFTGQIDEVRLSDVARYGEPFEPPRVHQRDAHTILLLHCDRQLGGAFLDDSGRVHHGWAVGAAKVERAER